MNKKITLQDIIESLIQKHSMERKDAEAFVKGMFDLIEDTLSTEKLVKIKGLGTFKLIDVDSRESINVNSGERFRIEGHSKISFIPDSALKNIINKPFSHFETVILNDGTSLEDTDVILENPSNILSDESSEDLQEESLDTDNFVDESEVDEENVNAEENIETESEISEEITAENIDNNEVKIEAEEDISPINFADTSAEAEEIINDDEEADQTENIDQAEETVQTEEVEQTLYEDYSEVEEQVHTEPEAKEEEISQINFTDTSAEAEEIINDDEEADQTENIDQAEETVQTEEVEQTLYEDYSEVEEQVHTEPEAIVEEVIEEVAAATIVNEKFTEPTTTEHEENEAEEEKVENNTSIDKSNNDENEEIDDDSQIEDNIKEKKYNILLYIAIILILAFAGYLFYYFNYGSSTTLDNPEPVAVDSTALKNSTDTIPDTLAVAPVVQDSVKSIKEEKLKKESSATDKKVEANTTKPEATKKTESVKVETKVESNSVTGNSNYDENINYKISGTKTTHTLKEGETIMRVALKYYGTKKLYKYILEYNKETLGEDGNKVRIGTKVKVPELKPLN